MNLVDSVAARQIPHHPPDAGVSFARCIWKQDRQVQSQPIDVFRGHRHPAFHGWSQWRTAGGAFAVQQSFGENPFKSIAVPSPNF